MCFPQFAPSDKFQLKSLQYVVSFTGGSQVFVEVPPLYYRV